MARHERVWRGTYIKDAMFFVGVISIICQVLGCFLTSDVLLIISIGAGLLFVVFFGSYTTLYRWHILRTNDVIGIISMIAISYIGWCGLYPASRSSLRGLIRDATSTRFTEITHALHAYVSNQKERRLPPAGLRDRDGHPLLSWRVLILPYIGYKDLYLRFRLDEPWNSPHNITLLPLMPDVFGPPSEISIPRESFSTFCQVFVGPGTAFGCSEGCRFPMDFPDGPWTVFLVEAGVAVPWSKPEDVPYRPDIPLPRLGACSNQEIRGFYSTVTDEFCITWGVGHARFILFKDLPKIENEFRAAITRDDGKDIGMPYWY